MDDDEPINPNIVCHVCGENEFQHREGFYYCSECGVKQEQVRLVEVENTDAFNETTGIKRQAKTTKLKVKKVEQPQVTSWECYNYILRGYVDELMTMGAKEELKLMVLQVWAAYLRRMEVAFFNKKQLELPRLGLRYLQNDVETIYNHSKKAPNKRRRKSKSDAASGTSDGKETSHLEWRKNKRKLDESLYSSVTSMTSASLVSSSNASAPTNRAIKLNYNRKARKFLKKEMGAQHLARHEADDGGLLQCHKQPRTLQINRHVHQLTAMSLKQIYAVLGIALNLIGDDIQLCDLVRFNNEGHIGWKNVLLYFPENIAKNGKDLLKKIDFYKFPEKYAEKFMRDHISLLCGNLHIHKFKMPNMGGLVRRYVSELCLPQDIASFAERLINFLPPRFETRCKHNYPHYEARAMAYIVFILKLIFGLDGQKENRMSSAAIKLNRKIQDMNKQYKESRPLLFVWNEWVEYIEMRKIIVSRFNPAFCRQFKQGESATQIMEQMSRGIQQREEENQNLDDPVEKTPYYKKQFDTFRSILNTMQDQLGITNEPINPSIEFKPTLTPALSYFKTILRHYDNGAYNGCGTSISGNEPSFKIHDFMRINHADRDIHSYVEVKLLVEFFENHQLELNVYSLQTTENRLNTGIFRFCYSNISQTLQRPEFNITDAEWAGNIKNLPAVGTDDLEWKTSLDVYDESYFKIRLNQLHRKRNTNSKQDLNNSNIPVDNKQTCLTSIEVFTENNMDPLEADNAPAQPRRDLDKFNIFEDIDDEESLIHQQCDEEDVSDAASNMSDDRVADILNSSMESMPIKSEVLDTTFVDEVMQIKSEFIEEPEIIEQPATPNSNKVPSHKFYVSNMDCWMLMGNVALLSKPQRSELKEKFPTIFKWVIETCAQTLGIKWIEVYEQLLAIEIMFALGVEDLDKVENCVYLNYLNPIKDIQTLINTYREIW